MKLMMPLTQSDRAAASNAAYWRMCHQRVLAKEPDIRFAVHALEGERKGPDIEKTIVIESGRDLVI